MLKSKTDTELLDIALEALEIAVSSLARCGNLETSESLLSLITTINKSRSKQ